MSLYEYGPLITTFRAGLDSSSSLAYAWDKPQHTTLKLAGFYLDFDFPTKDMIENGGNLYEARGKMYIVISL